MPYSNENEAREAGFPTELDGAALTIEQINHLAVIFDELREKGDIADPMAAAIAGFRERYEIKDGSWAPKEAKNEEAGAASGNSAAAPAALRRAGGIVSLSAVSLPDGGIEGGRIPDQIILHTGVWRGGEVEITGEILEMMLENYISLSDKSAAPYLEPYVKCDHSLSVNDIVGHWENLRVEQVEIPTARGALDVTALVGDEVITNPEALEKIARGEWTRRSAEFVRSFRDEATGEEFEWVLLGSAYVDIPEITSIPPVRVPIAAAPTLEEAVVELKKVRCAGCVARGAEKEMRKSRENDILENRKDSVELRKLREDCENLRWETAQRQEEFRRFRRERRLEELRRPGGNGLALPEATIALIREGMEKFGGAGRVKLRRGGAEVEADLDDFIVALAAELRDTGLVDTRVLTFSGPRDDDERKAERMARERGYITEK